jgi:hypothetical protein
MIGNKCHDDEELLKLIPCSHTEEIEEFMVLP